MATIYFYNAVSTNWDDAGNWFTDYGDANNPPVDAYGQIPQDGDTVYMSPYTDNTGVGYIEMWNSYDYPNLVCYIGSFDACNSAVTGYNATNYYNQYPENNGILNGGTWVGNFSNYNGTINGGSFGLLSGGQIFNNNGGIINDGQFNGCTNGSYGSDYQSVINGGTFTNEPVYNYNTINNGLFQSDNSQNELGFIYGGTFTGINFYNSGGAIYGGTFTGNNFYNCTGGDGNGGDSGNNSGIYNGTFLGNNFSNAFYADYGIIRNGTFGGTNFQNNGGSIVEMNFIASTDPGVANVNTGTTYQINGTSLTGTLTSTDPGVANVLDGIAYEINSSPQVGTLNINYAY